MVKGHHFICLSASFTLGTTMLLCIVFLWYLPAAAFNNSLVEERCEYYYEGIEDICGLDLCVLKATTATNVDLYYDKGDNITDCNPHELYNSTNCSYAPLYSEAYNQTVWADCDYDIALPGVDPVSTYWPEIIMWILIIYLIINILTLIVECRLSA